MMRETLRGLGFMLLAIFFSPIAFGLLVAWIWTLLHLLGYE